MTTIYSWVIDGKAPFDHLAKVLEYLWADERRDYGNDPTADHVFVSLAAVANWLNNADWTPAMYAAAGHTVREKWRVSAMYTRPPRPRRLAVVSSAATRK